MTVTPLPPMTKITITPWEAWTWSDDGVRRPGGSELGLDMNLRHQRPVHWALVRNVQQTRALVVAEHASQFHDAFDVIEPPFFGLARLTVGGVNPPVTESDRHGLERPLRAPGVHRHGHRRTGSERRQQEVVRRRTGIGSADVDRLVACELMSSGGNRLREA